jgi:hypothetical protein
MQRSLPVAAAVLALSASACGPMGPLNSEARDTWHRTYTLSRTGEVDINNINGRIDVEGTDGTTVEVDAERVARAATDQLAHELLPRIAINDRTTPDLVFVETGRVNGILIGASYSVHYHVKAPRGVAVHATTVNGGVAADGLAGRATLRATNGGIQAKNLTGGLEARTVNGGVRAEFSGFGQSDVNLATVNGGIQVRLPPSAKLTLNATWVNGGFNQSGLTFDVRDSGRRHFEGLLNGGGTSMTLTTVNGGIRIGTGPIDGDAGDPADAAGDTGPRLHDRAAP